MLECIPDVPLEFTITKFHPITHKPVSGKLWHTFLPVDHTFYWGEGAGRGEKGKKKRSEVNFLSVYVFLPFFLICIDFF